MRNLKIDKKYATKANKIHTMTFVGYQDRDLCFRDSSKDWDGVIRHRIFIYTAEEVEEIFI